MSAADHPPPVAGAAVPRAATRTDPWRAALDTAVELAPDRCPPQEVERLLALRDHVEARLALGDGSTVAALAGGTGVGKSALLNRLVGSEVVVEGVRRPTTDHAVAVTAALGAPIRRLLDWLGIDDRREVPGALPDGLVLVDLPDHDSVAELHRSTSGRLAARVDVLVVVVDPVKYARADLHEGPLADLRAHAEVLTIVLNRTDELAADDVARLRDDLARRLAADGLGTARVHTTSASTGVGVPALRDHLAEVAGQRRAVARRLAADAAVVAEEVLARTPDLPAASLEVAPLVDAALEASDGHRALVAAAVEQRAGARRATRSPLARAVRAPVTAAAHLGRGMGFGRGAEDAADRQAPLRSQRSLARRLAQELGLATTVGSDHTALGRSVEKAAEHAAPRVVDAVRSVTAEVAGEPRRWWPAMAGARGVAEAAAVAGLAWLVLLGVVEWLGLPELPPPALTDALSWPAALLLGGIAARVLLGLLTRLLLRLSSRRLRTRAARRLRQRLAESVTDDLLATYEAEAAATSTLRTALTTLRDDRPGR